MLVDNIEGVLFKLTRSMTVFYFMIVVCFCYKNPYNFCIYHYLLSLLIEPIDSVLNIARHPIHY